MMEHGVVVSTKRYYYAVQHNRGEWQGKLLSAGRGVIL
jgi:hypothetical protein